MIKEEGILFSGSAQGAETYFGEIAEKFGLEEVNFSFEGREHTRTRGIRILTHEELQNGDVSLAYISKLWKRPVTLRTAAHFSYESTTDKNNDKKGIRGENLVVYMSHDGNNTFVQEPSKSAHHIAQDYFDAKWRTQKFNDTKKDELSEKNII